MTAPYDVIVVGGGPAGSATAARLASAGHRVLVLDRAVFPRPKPCGECLSPAAVSALGRLGALDRVRAAPHSEIEGWRIEPELGPMFVGCFPAHERGIAIARESLDAILLNLAAERGAEVRTGVRVGELIEDRGKVAGVRTSGPSPQEFRARLVVGADGLRSVVVRRARLLARGPRLRKVALTAHMTGASDLGGRGELHLFRGGCLGVAAIGDGSLNVTVVVTGAEAERAGRDKRRYFDAVVGRFDQLAGCARESDVLATGPFDWPISSAITDGALVVGDAAGYYDPFTGQGIYRALRGAELAAEVVDDALRVADFSERALRPYELARRREFSPGVRLQHAIEFFTSRPALMRAVATRLAARSRLSDALVSVTGDLDPVRSLLAPRHLAALFA